MSTPYDAPYKQVQRYFKALAEAAIRGKLRWDVQQFGKYVRPENRK